MELTDRVYVAKARSGDADAYRVLVERHSRSLFRLAYRMTLNEQDAEDVLQESFLRAYRWLGRFDERASFGTWLYRIAANCALDGARSIEQRSARARGGGDAGAEPGRAHRVRAAAFRGHVHRGGEPRARLQAGRGQAQRVPRGAKATAGARAANGGSAMNHLSEEQLILHYYGEGAGEALPVEVHLEDCASCRAAYAALQRVLNVVDGLEAPVRGAEYGAQVWERVAAQIPGRRRLLWLPIQGWAPLRWAAVSAVMAGLLVAAFFAGRFYPQPRRAAPMAA